jgi:hypothetical protein
MTSPALLEELKVILSEEYNLNKSTDEVSLIADQLVGYFDTLAQISHRTRIKPVTNLEDKSG